MNQKKLDKLVKKISVQKLEERIAPDWKCGNGMHWDAQQGRCVHDIYYILPPKP